MPRIKNDKVKKIYYTIGDIAACTGLSDYQVRHIVEGLQLPTNRIGKGRIRIHVEDLNKYFKMGENSLNKIQIKKKLGSIRRLLSETEMAVLNEQQSDRHRDFIEVVRKSGQLFQVALVYFLDENSNGNLRDIRVKFDKLLEEQLEEIRK